MFPLRVILQIQDILCFSNFADDIKDALDLSLCWLGIPTFFLVIRLRFAFRFPSCEGIREICLQLAPCSSDGLLLELLLFLFRSVGDTLQFIPEPWGIHAKMQISGCWHQTFWFHFLEQGQDPHGWQASCPTPWFLQRQRSKPHSEEPAFKFGNSLICECNGRRSFKRWVGNQEGDMRNQLPLTLQYKCFPWKEKVNSIAECTG